MDSFKLDTKEKFNVITLNNTLSADNTSEKLRQLLQKILQSETKNVILNLSLINTLSQDDAKYLLSISEEFMQANSSLVICCAPPEMKSILKEMELDELLNITPTESEAYDIVQMEEIERELFSEENE